VGYTANIAININSTPSIKEPWENHALSPQPYTVQFLSHGCTLKCEVTCVDYKGGTKNLIGYYFFKNIPMWKNLPVKHNIEYNILVLKSVTLYE